MTTFRIDRENNGETFWTHVNEYDVIHMASISDEARAAVAPLLTDSEVREIEVSDEVGRELLEWFDTLPGWWDDDAPEYAPHPLTWDAA